MNLSWRDVLNGERVELRKLAHGDKVTSARSTRSSNWTTWSRLSCSVVYLLGSVASCLWASERAMDMLADRLGIDPLELRLKNVLRDGDIFCTGETSTTSTSRTASRRPPRRSGGGRDGSGKGLCVLLKGMQTPSRAAIAVEAEDDGRYTLRCATAEMGQGSRRALSLVAAELLGVGVDRVRFPDPDTDSCPTTPVQPPAVDVHDGPGARRGRS